MPTHLVFKQSAFDAYDYFMKTFVEYKRFVCEELGEEEDNLHRHVYYDGEFRNIETLRKQLNKHRATPKVGNVSIKLWDDNLRYFCKGTSILQPPKIIVNEMGVSPEAIRNHQADYWAHPSNLKLRSKDKMSVLDILVQKCRSDRRWPQLTSEIVASHWVDIYIEAGLKRTLGSKFQMENQIKTVLLYMNPDMYKAKLMDQCHKIFY